MRANKNIIRKLGCWLRLIILVIIFSVTCILHLEAQAVIKTSIWKDISFQRVPTYQVVSKDSAIGLIYTGSQYQGHEQRVFAYYATPGTITGNKSLDKNLPAIILVHGGGGRAFKSWAIKWAKKGYAAFAMDLRGNGPDKKHLVNGFVEPNDQTPYFDVNLPLEDQWMYQAVANVLRANNLIRSFKEVDHSRIAITGISWGGVIVCNVAALDPRYKAAVPVYGCGYLGESGRMQTALNALPKGNKYTWLTQYDPSAYLKAVKMPMLFLNDANDPYFELPSFMRSYSLVKTEKKVCIKINLKHSHQAGWSNKEIYTFINHHLRGGPALPAIVNVTRTGNLISCQLAKATAGNLVKLNYAGTRLDSSTNRKWATILMKEDREHHFYLPIPECADSWYVSVENDQGLLCCSPVGFTQVANKR